MDDTEIPLSPGGLRFQAAQMALSGEKFTLRELAEKLQTLPSNVRAAIDVLMSNGFEFDKTKDGPSKGPTPAFSYRYLGNKGRTATRVTPMIESGSNGKGKVGAEDVETSVVDDLIGVLGRAYPHGIPFERVERAAQWMELTRELFRGK